MIGEIICVVSYVIINLCQVCRTEYVYEYAQNRYKENKQNIYRLENKLDNTELGIVMQ